MPGNDAVLFFSETPVVEVKEIIMSAVFSAAAVGSFAGRLSAELRPGRAGTSVNTPLESQLQQEGLSHLWLPFYRHPRQLYLLRGAGGGEGGWRGRGRAQISLCFEDLASRPGLPHPPHAISGEARCLLLDSGDDLKSLSNVGDNPVELLPRDRLLRLGPHLQQPRPRVLPRALPPPCHPVPPATTLSPGGGPSTPPNLEAEPGL